MVQALEARVTTWPLKMSSSSRSRFRLRSMMVTCAPMPTAILAALVPTTPPPRMTTLAGATPGTPPSRMPRPPLGASRYCAPTCTAMRPATSLMGVSRGSEPSALANGLVGHAAHLGRQQPVGQFRQRRQVQIGEQDQARAEVAVLGRLRLLDLDDQVGLAPDLGRAGDDCRAGLHVFPVGDGAAFPGVGLDQHLVSRLAQRRDAAGDQPHAGLVIFDFLGNADDHGCPSDCQISTTGGWWVPGDPVRIENRGRGITVPRQFDVAIERDGEGYYVASVPQLPGCHTQAKSLDEVMDRIREAAELCLDVQVRPNRLWSSSAFSALPSPHEPNSARQGIGFGGSAGQGRVRRCLSQRKPPGPSPR